MANPFELPDDSAAPAPVEQNPFALPADTIAAPQRLRLALDIASRENPEQSAIAQHIARTANVPLGVVERNLPEFQRQAKLADLNPDRLATDAPATARFLSDVNAAKLAHDDVERLAELEALMRQSSITNAPSALYDTLGDVSLSVLKGAVGLPQAVVGLADIPTLGRAGKALESIGYRPAQAQKIIESVFSPEMRASLARVQNADGFFDTLGTVLTEPRALSNTIIESLPLMLGGAGIARGANAALLRIPGPAPLVLPPIAAGALGEGVIGAGAAASQIREQTADGELTPAQAGAAVASGVGTGLLGALGGTVATRFGIGDIDAALAAGQLTGTPKAGFAKQVIGSGISEGFFEELPQSAQEQMWQNFAMDRPLLQGVANAAAVGLVAGAVTGGAFGTYNATLAALIERSADAQAQVDQALSDAQRLQAAMGAAAQSQLRERSPETFQQLVEQIAADNEGAQSIYIDGQVLAQSGVDIAQAFPSLADQVNEAAFLNSTVEIPLAEVLTAVPGTPLEELFLQNAKSSPDALSQAEVEQAGEQGQQFIQQEAERVLQQAQEREAWQSEVDTVQQTIKGQLDQAGRFTSDVNEGYARLQSQFFSVMASRFGITPTEMYQRFSVKVAGQMGQGEVLNAGRQGEIADVGTVRTDGTDAIASNGSLNFLHGSNSAGLTVDQIQIVRDGQRQAKKGRKYGGFYLSSVDDIQSTQDYASMGDGTPTVYNVRIKEGTKILKKRGDITRLSETYIAELVAQGYGLVVGTDPRGRTEYVVIDNNAVESMAPATGNSGAFDPNDPNILRQSALADDAVDEASDDAPSAMEQADVPASVDDAAALSSALRVATSSIWRKGRDLKVAIQNAVQAAARAAGVDVGVESPQSEAYLVRVGLRDALDALKQNANAVGWYDLKTRQALAVMSLVHPELATDEDARLAFVWIMAVTSNGLKVGKNFELAETAYRRYKQDGRMPTDVGVGNASKAINDSLGLFDTLKTQWGSENLRKFMLTPFLVEEISALSKDLTPGGEHADVEVRGAAILGPKIGNGFFSNLYGNFDALTMDRWLIRTWGRWSGTLIKDMPRHTAEARARVREVMAKIEANLAERDRLSALISHTFDTSTEAGLDAIALAVQKASMKPNLRAEMNKTEVGSELRLSGNGLAKYLDGQKEAPSGPWERKYIRRVFQGILAELKGQPEYANLTMADLQAVLWYAEKRLYEAAKTDLAAEDEVDGYEDDEAPDYANAAVDVARSAGVSERKINNALKKEQYGGRSATARSASDSQTGSQGQPREAGGFTGREKREFRATVAIHRARRIRSALIGDERSPWTYTRRSGTDGPRVRVLKKLGIKYTEQWKAGTALARTLKNNGQKVPTFYELDSGSADKFRDAIAASKAASPFGAAVYVYPLEEYQGMRLFLSEEGAGFALKPDGDIVSVFGGGGTGHATMDLAITLGGRKLDCFDTVLPRIYSVHGFVPAARLTWDDSQAPEGWSKQTFGEYNDGEPDVLFMAYDPTSFAPYATGAGSRVSTYNGALRVQARAVRNAFGVAQPNLFEQQARGTFNPQTLLISLGPQSDLSTFLHESGHFFLEVMADLAAQPDAPAQVREDMDKVLGWFGVPDLATWQGYTLDQKRPHHERWAESFEQYLLEGKAPSAELQPLFRRFRAWLVNVYKSLTDFMRGRNLELNDEIRQVFDRMLATDEQIAQAEEQAGLLPDFDATNAAIERLQERSLRNLKWTLNARSKFLKQFTKEARELRKGVLAEVMAEFEQRPDVMASRAIRKVRNKDGAERDAKIAAIADATGYPTVEEMTAAVTALGPVNEAVEAEVDRRMLERHGDMATQEALEAAANEAVHNEARARALAAELKSQDEALNPRETTGRTDARGRPITVNALVEAARAFGADLAARRAVGKLKNAIYLHRAAEARAGKAWQTATKKGDSKAAVQAKKDQLLNNQAVRALLDAQAEVRSAIEFFRKVTKGNNEKLVKGGRDPDVVNAMRAILGAYGIAPRTGKTALEYMELVQKNDPAMYGVIAPGVNTALANAKPFSELTVEEVRGLTDELKSLWHLAKRSRQMEIDGDLLDLEDLADQLYARMEDIGIPDVLPGETGALTDAELRKRNWLQQAPAILRRVEQWAEAKDGAFGGPFLRFIFQPVKIAADRYRADRLVYRQKFQALVDAIAPTMAKTIIAAPELDYTFGRGHNGIGMAEVLHAILHTGNDSNKRKLLLGRNWATENPDGTLDTSRWDAFIARLITEGTLTKAHYDFAQGVWDLMEETKPLAQKTHRDVFGRYFAEVTANEVQTPFGTYRGGYVPAQADPLLVQDADQRELLETENAGMSYAFPATNKGFTKGRVEYNRPLKLDLRTLPQHIDKVLLFSHMEPAVRGVDRLLRRKKIAQALNKIDPAAINGMLKPWLNRSARQTVETPVSADAGMNRMLSQARARTGMALMMGNISNTLQQITGFSTALLKVKGSHMRRAVAQYIADPKQLKNTVWSLSPYMADRASNEVAVLSDTLEAILLNPSVYQSAERFTRRHAYFLQTAMDNQMSPIIWTGAYNQALAEGMEDRMARRYADGVIRQTQGSTLPEDVSRIENGTAFARVFTQFVGYFNMLANTNATALQQIAREQGLRKGAGKAFGVLMLGMMIPIWVAEVIAQAFRGGPEDDEDDGYLDDWLAAVFGFGTIRGILSGVPVIAQMGQSMVNRFNDNPADDKFSLSPTVSVLESAVAAPHSVYKAIFDEGSAQKAVRDMSALITLRTGLPAMTLARPLGYAAGVAQGKIEPTGPADFARGMVTGTASPESKNP